MRQKPQNSKGYAESPEFTGAIICLSLQVDVNYITSLLDYFYTYNNIIYIRTPSHSHYCVDKDGIRLFLELSICDLIS